MPILARHASSTRNAYGWAVGLALGLLASIPTEASNMIRRADVQAVVPRIEAHVRKTMQEWNTPGLAVGIVAEDELVYAQGFGVREVGGTAPVTPETVFQIGSTTKAFLGVTLAMLVDDGALDWDDRVIDHAPGFRLMDPWVTREFRIRDLLAQRSGLPAYVATNMMTYGYDADDIIRALEHFRPVSSFRSSFAYQNAFHLVAGQIVAQRSGAQAWADVLRTRLLEPIGMTSTSATADGLRQAFEHASGHRSDTEENVVDPFGMFPYNAEGAGGLNSSVRDLARWLRLHLNGGVLDGTRVISQAELQETYAPLVLITGPMHELLRLGDSDLISYATGWIVHSTPEGRVIEHGGGTTGFVSYVGFDPDRRFGVVVLVNQSVTFGNGIAAPLGRYIMDALQGRPESDYAAQILAATRKALAEEREQEALDARYSLPPEALEAYTGRYESPVLGQIEIVRDADGTLGFELGPQRLAVRLEPRPNDVFIATIPAVVRDGDPYTDRVRLHFQSDETGRMAQIHWLGGTDQAGQPPFRRVDTSDAGTR